MITRLEVGLQRERNDPRGDAACQRGREFLGLQLERIRTRTVFKIGMPLTPEQQAAVQGALTDPVIEDSAIGQLPLPPCDWVLRVGFKPGVTDNVGRTARVFIADLTASGGPASKDRSAAGSDAVFTETLYLISAPEANHAQIERLASELLANPLIERIDVWSSDDYRAAPVDLELPLAGTSGAPTADAVELPADDEALLELSRSRMLSLDLAEMRAIQAHYQDPAVRAHREAAGLPTAPTDVELEALAQTWSEHCKHKIFAARIRYTDERGETEEIRSLFKTYIVDATRRIGERVDWLVSVFDDNAGVVRVAPNTHLVYKVETHNSPSALDPYGGAITGIVGVNRDPFGTGIGAALLTNVWGYCFGPPDFAGALPAGLHHPRRIRDGVHHGVIDGGNQSGIPYSRGWELFDERFIGKPLVFCGTVGVMPATVRGAPSERKAIETGDVVVMVGGRIGKDGIHGATFSSEALHGASPAQAVQIGDAITQKMMTDMLLEARDLGLYRTLTDNGAGGLSSSVGEMARLSGGATLQLERAPLKYPGLMPWEILLSEAQERMTLAVPPDKLDALLELAARREVEATAVGHFDDSGRFRARHGDELVCDLSMEFLHDGCPVMELEARWEPASAPEAVEVGVDLESENLSRLLEDMAADLDLCSKENTCRQYDHEVKGLSVIKPLVGAFRDVPADATVMRIEHGQPAALLLAEGVAPQLSDIDAGQMAAWVVDLAVRRIVAGGGRLGSIAVLDNFCWPDPVQSDHTPDGRLKLAHLVRCCQRLAEMTDALDLPLISGKDSMKNDSTRGGVKISIPPTLLLSALGWIPDARRAMDLVLPADGEHDIYLLGETNGALGASALYRQLGRRSGQRLVGRSLAPASPEATRSTCRAMQALHDDRLVAAIHAPHVGGIGMGLASLCLAGGRGLEVDLAAVPRAGDAGRAALLFSEGGSRFIFAAPVERRDATETRLAALGAPWGRIGRTQATLALRILEGDAPQAPALVELPLARLRDAFVRRGM